MALVPATASVNRSSHGGWGGGGQTKAKVRNQSLAVCMQMTFLSWVFVAWGRLFVLVKSIDREYGEQFISISYESNEPDIQLRSAEHAASSFHATSL